MPSVVLSPSAGASISLVLDYAVASQDIAGNYTTLNYNLYLYRNNTGGSSSFDSTNSSVKSLTINGTLLINATTNWDFRASSGLGGVGATNGLGSGSINIPHNADGTKTFSYSASFTDGGTVTIGHGTVSGNQALTTIPRASTPTFSASPADAGTTITVTTNRASGSFTHNISYAIGAASGTIGTGVGASTTWAIPLSLLNQIPNNVSGTVVITTDTYDGATYIGQKVVNLTMNAPSSVVPDFGTVTNSEATTTPAVATIVGAYVKGISTAAVAITSAVGAYGSTITASKIELLSGATVLVTLNAASGTIALPASGSLTLRGTVTDSRGRVHSEDVAITVLNYAVPTIPTNMFQRSTVGGTPDINGTYLRAVFSATVQSLIVGTQKNDLNWKIKTRAKGSATAWSAITPAATAWVGGVGYSDDEIVGTYATANSFEVRIEVTDKLGSMSYVEGILPTGGVLMHMSKTQDGTGFGKFHENYDGNTVSVDAKDYVYHRSGKRVLDVDDAASLTASITAATKDYVGTIDPYWTYGKPNVTLAGSGTVVSAFLPPNDDDIQPGSTVVLTQTGGSWYIEGAYAAAPKFLRQVPITLNTAGGWTQYDMIGTATFTGVDDAARFGPATVTKSATGWVLVTGLVYKATATGATPILVATLPPGFWPSYEVAFPVLNASEPTTYNVLVKPNGEIWTTSSGLNAGHISLNNIQFNHTAATTNLTMANSWVAFGGAAGTPRLGNDGQGLAFFAGAMKNGTTGAGVAFASTLAVADRPLEEIIMSAASTNVFGGRRISFLGVPAVLAPFPATTRYELEPMLWSIAANSPGYNGMAYGNGWASYGGGYADLQFGKRPDGLVYVKGLVKSGTMGQPIARLPEGYRPPHQLLFSANSNDAPASLGVYADGNIVPRTGTNVWFSINVLFAPGR